MSASDLVPVDQTNRGAVAAAIADGFASNEIWQWVVGSQRRLDSMLPRYYRTMIAHVFEPLGTAYTTAGSEGGALWYPPGQASRARGQHLRQLLAMLPEGGQLSARVPVRAVRGLNLQAGASGGCPAGC